MNPYYSNGKVYYRKLTDSQGGTEETLAEMTKLINNGKIDPMVIERARDIISDVPEKDYEQEADKIFKFVQKNVRYTKDVAGVETLTAPQRMLREIESRGHTFGDCDDKTILLGTLLESVGHQTRLVVTSQSPTKEFQHVYLEANLLGEWIPLDATKKDAQMGWEQPSYTMKARYNNEVLAENNTEKKPFPVKAVLALIMIAYFGYRFLRERE